ncbi:MAG: hypothetical protein V4710_00185 [Verrucomicrobiota bacterium]
MRSAAPLFFFHRARQGGSLVDVLVVIVVVAVLAALILPTGIISWSDNNGARRVQARNEVSQIDAAIRQFHTEYGHYPPLGNPSASTAGGVIPDQAAGDLSVAGIKVENSALFNVLRAIDAPPNKNHVLNPKRIIFFEGRIVFFEKRVVSKPKAPRGGFLAKIPPDAMGKPGIPVSEGCLLDPWGRQYCIVIDTNGDGLLDVDQFYSDFKETERPRATVGVFSMGQDNRVGTEKAPNLYRGKGVVSDDLISWQ